MTKFRRGPYLLQTMGITKLRIYLLPYFVCLIYVCSYRALLHHWYHHLKLGWDEWRADICRKGFLPEYFPLFATNGTSNNIWFTWDVFCFELDVIFQRHKHKWSDRDHNSVRFWGLCSKYILSLCWNKDKQFAKTIGSRFKMVICLCEFSKAGFNWSIKWVKLRINAIVRKRIGAK